MTQSINVSDTESVTACIQKLPAPFAELIESIRKIILSANAEIGEQIKWNSPSFFYTGEIKPFNPKEYKRDIVVLNLHKGYPLLVFPSGAKINDTSGLLEGKYTDGRRLVTIMNSEDLKHKEDALIKLIREWLALVEK